MSKIHTFLRKGVLACMLPFLAAQVSAQNVTVSGAANGDGSYPTVAAAFAALNGGTQTGSTIIMSIVNNTTEPATGAVLNANDWASLTIQPSGGAWTIGGAATAGVPLIDFNGADNVTVNGLNSGGNALTITNTQASSTSGTSTIRFQADATNNTITNATILGSANMAVGTNGGNIWFGAGAVTTGNDNNTISNCDIGAAGTALPTKGIYFSGTTTSTAMNNSTCTITNNRIFDFFGAAVTSAGVYISSGSTDITISGNKFYQTASRTQTLGSQHSAIWVANTSGNNYQIIGNTIGFANSAGTGTYSMIGITSSTLIPIFLSVGTTTATSVQGNTIAGISMSGTQSGTSSSAPLRCIYVSSGLTTVGDVTGNLVGSMTANGSISYTSSSTSPSDVVGIFNFGTANWVTNNNNVGGIIASNTSTGAANIYGIRCNTSSSVTWTCNNNNVGGNIPNSIQSTSTATGTVVNGILNSNPIGTFSSNSVSNLTTAGGTGSGSTASISGILSTSSAAQTITLNKVRGLSSTAAANVNGISVTSGSTHSIHNNIVANLQSSNAGGLVNGILVAGGTTVNVFNNRIADLRAPLTTGTTDGVRGISVTSTTTSSNVNVSFNSIYLSATSSGANFNTSGVFHTTSSTTTTATLQLRNNIVVNNSIASGTGLAAAYRRSSTTLTNFGSTSNNNLFFAPVIFTDGTNTDATLAAYKSRMGTRETFSVSENPSFISVSATDADLLKINPAMASMAESGGSNVSGVSSDFEGDIRHGQSGYAGSGAAPDLGADEFNGTTSNPFVCSGLPTPGVATGWMPVVVSGFTVDVIANGIGAPATTATAAADLATPANYFMDATYQFSASSPLQSFGLPTNGIIRSNANPGLTYQMQSSSSNNSLQLTGTGTGTLTMTTPVSTPTLSLLVASGNGPVPVDVTVTFTDASTQVFTAQSVFDWFNANPFAIKGIGRVDATGAFTGTGVTTGDNPRLYDLVLNLNESNYTKQVASVTITKTASAGIVNVFAMSVASVTQSALCNNATTKLTLSGASAGNGITYNWQESTTSGGTFTDISGAIANSYTTPVLTASMYYRVRIHCSVSGATSYTNEVAVNVSPAISVSATAPAVPICSPGGTAATLTANGTGGAGSLTYSWAPTTGITGSGSSVTALPAVTTSYTVTASDAAGCSASSAPVSVTVNPGVVLWAVSASPSSVCVGGSTNLLAAATAATNTSATMIFANLSGQSFATITSPVVVTTTTSNSLDDGSISVSAGSFAFPYLGNTYSSFGAGTNGYLELGAGASSSIPSSLTSVSGNVIYAFGRDGNLNVTNGGNLTHGPVAGGKYAFQYNNHSGGASGGVSATITTNFQILLWGTTSAQPGRIDIVYGSSLGTPASAGTIGIRDASGTFINAVNGSTTSTTTTSAWPAAGTMYSFTLPVPTVYAWTPSANLNDASIANPVVSNITASETFNVTVTHNGCSNSGSVTVTSGVPLTATATTTAAANTICTGQSSTIGATVSGGGAPYTYSWSVGGSPAGTTPTITVSPASTTVYDLLITDNCGTTTTSSVTLNVNPVPTAIATGGSTVCTEGTIQLNGSSDIGTTFSWTGPDGFASTVQNPQITSATFAKGGVYTLVTSLNGCNSVAATTNVAILASPTGVTATASPDPVCEGQQVTLTATGNVPKYSMNAAGTATFIDINTSGTNIAATFGDDLEYNVTFPAFTFNNTTYTTARVGQNGVIAFGSTTGDVGVANAALPTTSISAGSIFLAPLWDDLDVNMGGTIKSEIVGNKYILQWTNADHNLFTTGNVTFQVQLDLSNGQIHYVYQDIVYGSATHDFGASATVGLQLNSTTAIQYSANTATLANGQCITFTPTTMGVSWSGPAGFTGTNAVENLTASAASAGIYTAVVTNLANGCSITVTDELQTVSPAVNPTISVAASGNNICDGSAVTFTATVTNEGSSPVYSWEVNNSVVPGASASTYTYVPVSGDVVKGLVLSSESCAPATPVASNMITMVVNPIVTPTVTVNASASTVCAGGTATLTALSTDG
ncbi:MAG: hypothetical protein EOP49_02190, partial [Sphingobacteriales bacterium]